MIFGLEKSYIQFWKANSEYFSLVNNSPPPTAVFGSITISKLPFIVLLKNHIFCHLWLNPIPAGGGGGAQRPLLVLFSFRA